MMERQPDAQQKLFYTCLNLEKRIREDHILRKIVKPIDFDFIYKHLCLRMDMQYQANATIGSLT